MSQFCHVHHLRRSDGARKMSRKPMQKRTKKMYGQQLSPAEKSLRMGSQKRHLYYEHRIGKRKRPYVAHMSTEAFRKLKRRHKSAALEKAIAEWIAERDQ